MSSDFEAFVELDKILKENLFEGCIENLNNDIAQMIKAYAYKISTALFKQQVKSVEWKTTCDYERAEIDEKWNDYQKSNPSFPYFRLLELNTRSAYDLHGNVSPDTCTVKVSLKLN